MKNILSIDTSCDETSVAITQGHKIISNVLFSQIKVHAPYGGVYPLLAKREHLSKIGPAVQLALKHAHLKLNNLAAIAVTYGPGLAPALEVGINYAKELAKSLDLPLIPVDHIEGHIYSAFAQNSQENPKRQIIFPLLAYVVSGGHTELVLLKKHLNYKILGETLDDAAGEALDKAARILGLGYPGGPAIERLAKTGNSSLYPLPLPMQRQLNLEFSYSGLKTAFKRVVDNLSEKEKIANLHHLAASFQATVIKSLVYKLEQALRLHQPKLLGLGGGVAANVALKQALRKTANKHKLPFYFPNWKALAGDNAAMIGIVAGYKLKAGIFLKDGSKLDRCPRANLDSWVC